IKSTKLTKKIGPFACILANSDPSIGILVLTKRLDRPKRRNSKNDHIRTAFCPKNARNFKRFLLIQKGSRTPKSLINFFQCYGYHYQQKLVFENHYLTLLQSSQRQSIKIR